MLLNIAFSPPQMTLSVQNGSTVMMNRRCLPLREDSLVVSAEVMHAFDVHMLRAPNSHS